MLTPDTNNSKDNADNAEDPDKLYQVSIKCYAPIFSPRSILNVLKIKKDNNFQHYISCSFHVAQEIAKRYPDVPLSTVLIAEKKFVEADLDRNGVRQVLSTWC